MLELLYNSSLSTYEHVIGRMLVRVQATITFLSKVVSFSNPFTPKSDQVQISPAASPVKPWPNSTPNSSQVTNQNLHSQVTKQYHQVEPAHK